MMGWRYGLFGGIEIVLFRVVIVVLVLLAVRGFAGGRWTPAERGAKPLDILKERYARGEIDKAEYDERRKVLSE